MPSCHFPASSLALGLKNSSVVEITIAIDHEGGIGVLSDLSGLKTGVCNSGRETIFQ